MSPSNLLSYHGIQFSFEKSVKVSKSAEGKVYSVADFLTNADALTFCFLRHKGTELQLRFTSCLIVAK